MDRQESQASASTTPQQTVASTSVPTYSHTSAMASSTVEIGEMAQNGEAESSKMASKGLDTGGDPMQHALGLADFIFNVGYLGQNWADIQVTFFDTGVKLHRIVLARSPFLLHYMLTAVSGSIHLEFDDDSITPESVHIALQHMYRPSQHLVTASNSRPVLATALLFGGMSDLVEHAYRITSQSISADNVIDLVGWTNRASTSRPQVNGDHSSNGTLPHGGGRYGEYSSRLQDEVNDFLVSTLPKEADEAQLVTTYSRLPFDQFKQCVESPELPMESTQKRFAFAKKVIANRKRAATANQMEEAAVLAMQGDGMAVVVTRKPKRGRQFFKVEG